MMLPHSSWANYSGTVDHDVDFTQNLTKIGFFWKSNTTRGVKWILSDKRQWALCNGSAYVLECGRTSNSVVIVSASLQRNRRYYFCVLDEDAFDTSHSVCSDGVTVDVFPPKPGVVEIGGTDNQYQTYRNMLLVRWRDFSDVEEDNPDVHVSGIAKFCVSVGKTRRSAPVHVACSMNFF